MNIGYFDCLICIGVFAGISVHANAIEVTAEQVSKNESTLTAANQSYGTKSAIITVRGRDIASNIKFPVQLSLPPGQSIQLGKIFNNAPESETKFNIITESQFGKLGAENASNIYYRLPFQDGLTFRISQAFGGAGGTHQSADSLHAVDFDMPIGTPVVAARSGVVVDARYDSDIGGPHDKYLGKENFVSIEHDDGTLANYAHLSRTNPFVQIGQRVQVGYQLGLSGNTGYSTGPHLHFSITRPAIIKGKLMQESIPFTFFAHKPPVLFKPRPMIIVTSDYKNEFQGRTVSTKNQSH